MSSMALKGEVELVGWEVQFEEAVKRDEIPHAWDLLLKHPDTAAWPANPLHIACQHERLHFAMGIGRLWPKLTTIANQDGDIAMHIACTTGNVEMVEWLGKLNPGSCLAENHCSMIPLHVAAVNGHFVVLRKLVSLCPVSLQKVTFKQDTVFHLALKNSQTRVFQVLVDEARKLNQGHLLNKKDKEGNTVLHIAAVKKLNEIMWLLLDENSSSHIKMQVNSKNKRGLTALDLWRANSPDTVSQEINLILQKAADNERCSLEPPRLVPNRALIRWPVETRNVLLVVLVMIAAAAFAVTCNLPDTLLKERYRSDLISCATASDVISGRLPTVVYLMVFNSAGFMTSMAVISYLIWPLPLRSILLFVLVCTCIVYIILVGKITPKFSGRVWNLSFSSITLVWSSVLAFIVFGITTITVGKYALQCNRQFLK